MAAGTPAKCGSSHLKSDLTSAPVANLCAVGTPTAVRGDGPWTWQCRTEESMVDACVAAPGKISIINIPITGRLVDIKNAIEKARALFDSKDSANQNTTVVLKFAPGTYNFSQDTSVDPKVYCTTPGACVATKSISLNNLNPGPKGRLILYGAGLRKTRFVFNPDQTQFHGSNSSRISIVGIHLTLDRMMVSQGTVVNPMLYVDRDAWIAVDIPEGFPGLQTHPLGLFNPSPDEVASGRHLRRYKMQGDRCDIDKDFHQLYYDAVKPDGTSPNRWWLHIVPKGNGHYVTLLKTGDLIGIKSKAGVGQAYFFSNSNQLTFDQITWSRHSRGVFRGGTKNIHIYDSMIISGRTPQGVPICMGSSAGGPQIGQPYDPPTYGNVVDNLRTFNTGDDAIALFNSYDPENKVMGTKISDSYVLNSFGRSILMYQSPYPESNSVVNTKTVNCTPQEDAKFSQCMFETQTIGGRLPPGVDPE